MRKEAAPRHRPRRRGLQPSVVPWPDTEPLISRQPRLAGPSRFRTTGQVFIQSETKLRGILLIAKRTEGDCIDRRALSLPPTRPMQKSSHCEEFASHRTRTTHPLLRTDPSPIERPSDGLCRLHRSSQTKVASVLQAANQTRREKDRDDGNIALPRYPENFPVNPGAWRRALPMPATASDDAGVRAPAPGSWSSRPDRRGHPAGSAAGRVWRGIRHAWAPAPRRGRRRPGS